MSATTRDINRPENSFKINYITLRTEKGTRYNIQPIMQGLILYEDIFDYGITGVIALKDQNDIISGVPIIGREFLDISFSSRDNLGEFLPAYEKTFAITKVAGHMHDRYSGLHHSVLSFGPVSYVEDSTVRITRSFASSAPHEIVKHTAATIGILDADIEETLHPRSYVFCQKRPFSLIETMCLESQSAINNSTDFVFFENKYGWHYRGLYSLMTQGSSADITNEHVHQGNTYDRLNLVYYHVDSKFDAATMRKKFLGNSIQTHDPITKKIITQEADYKSHFAQFPTMNGSSFFVEDLVDDASGYIAFDVTDGPYASHSDSDKNQRLQRDICRDMLNGYIATGKMPGNCDITAGIVVDLKMLSTNLNDREDIFKAGKHLITKVKHEITLTEYWTTIQIQKDSYLPTQKKLS